jgi:hypothetical protein
MRRSYSIFVMLKHAMLLSVFLEFSSNTSVSSFFLLVTPLTFKLAFLLLCVPSKISFKKMMSLKGQYPQIHKQLTHTFLLMLTMTTTLVSLQRMTMKEVLRSSYKGSKLPMKCGTAT